VAALKLDLAVRPLVNDDQPFPRCPAVAALQGVHLVGKDKDGWVDFSCPEHGKFRIRPSGNSAVFCPHCPPEVVWAAIMAHEAQHRTHKEMGEPYPDAPAGDEP
jgi:hypothetical protein